MAIAFNAAADGGNNGGSTNSLSYSYTASSGSNRLLLVGIVGDVTSGADDITSVTYNSVAMTLVAKRTTGGTGNRFTYLYYLLNPASGANSVAISSTASHFLISGAADYTGVAQSGQPDASTTNATTTQSLTTTLTTVTDNDWTMLILQGFDSNIAPSAGTGSTRRTFDGAFGTLGLFDSNGTITPPGSTSMSGSWPGGSDGVFSVMAAFAPAVAADILMGQAWL